MSARLLAAAAWLAIELVAPAPVRAHTESTAYLNVVPQDDGATRMQWRVALRDLDVLVDLDRDGDGRLTWGEVEDRAVDLDALMHVSIEASAGGTSCALGPTTVQFVALGQAGYAQLSALARCPAGATPLVIAYHAFDRIDPSHRVVVNAGNLAPHLLAPGTRVSLPVGREEGALEAGLAHYLTTGFWHILGGFDHLLFVIGLLLPAVLQRRPHGARGWVPRDDLRSALVAVATIATAFTVAHSLTLAAATFGWMRVRPSVIEPLIALTVLATALNNIWPLVTRRLWVVAFGFGLVHGFGFAEVLAPLALPPRELAFALLGFNVGVELGQLSVVAVAFSLLAAARHWSGYVRIVLQGGSAAVALLAVGWIVQRVGIA